MGSLHWSLSSSRNKMKISLILTLTLVAVSYGTPLQPDKDLVSPQDNEAAAPAPDELQRSRRSIHGCAYQVRVTVRTKDSNHGPYQNHVASFGTYTIQNGEIHGRDWWKKGNGKAIWYDGGGWNVGDEEYKGTRTSELFTYDDQKCPEGTGYTWRYWVSSINDWVDAGRHMYIRE